MHVHGLIRTCNRFQTIASIRRLASRICLREPIWLVGIRRSHAELGVRFDILSSMRSKPTWVSKPVLVVTDSGIQSWSSSGAVRILVQQPRPHNTGETIPAPGFNDTVIHLLRCLPAPERHAWLQMRQVESTPVGGETYRWNLLVSLNQFCAGPRF